MTACPTGCGRHARPGHLMCRTCWYKVPAALRSAVWRTWRRYDRIGSSEDDFERYEQAREAAIASVP
ncbi:MAG: hypothetical protein ACRD0W_00635 [Acidimicrobiales bacterium]